MRYYIPVLSVFLFLGCGGHMHDDDAIEVARSTLYYGDINNDDVIALDIDQMKVLKSINSNGIYPYEVAVGFGEELFVINRADDTIGILDSVTDTISAEVDLNFYPRSTSINNNDTLVTSANDPAAAIIVENIASDTYTDSSYVNPKSYGGDNATGHPVWVDDKYFLLLDRTENSIELYQKDNFTPVDKLTTLSSVHHVMFKEGYFYGISEGEQGVVSPGIVKFSVKNGKITLVIERLISSLSNLPNDFKSDSWGAHHGAFHPTKAYIYIGSAEGNVFVLDLATLHLADTFKSGKGVGHFSFYNDMLIVTNHYDNFKSFYDASNPRAHTLIKNLKFSDEVYDGITMQSHTSHIVDKHLYFMFNSDHNSTLFKVDLESLTISDSLTLENCYCLMGSFVESTELVSGM